MLCIAPYAWLSVTLQYIIMSRIKLLIAFTLISAVLCAQSVGINEAGSSPNSKAILDVESTSKGLLLPRMNTTQRTAMTLGMSEKGMMVYDTQTNSFWVYDGSTWIENLGTSSGDTDWLKQGSSTEAGANTDNVYHIGNIAIGKNTTNHPLDIQGGDGKNINLEIVTNVSGIADRTYATYSNIVATGAGSVYASENIISGTSKGERRGYHTNISGSSSESTGHSGFSSFINSSHVGSNSGTRNFVSNQGSGPAYGSFTNIADEGTGRKYGSYNNIATSGSSKTWGNYNNIVTSSTGQTSGTYNKMQVNANASVSGVHNDITSLTGAFLISTYNDVINGANGSSIGTWNELNGTSNGFQYASRNHVVVDGIGEQVGSYQYITGAGQGYRYGVLNQMQLKQDNAFPSGVINKISGINDSNISGLENEIDTDGTGDRYGLFSKLGMKGSGDKYGTYSNIDGASPGNKYGHYTKIDGTTSSVNFGSFYELSSNQGEMYGTYMRMNASSTSKLHIGDYKEMTSQTGNVLTAHYNTITSEGVIGSGVGVSNNFDGIGGGNSVGIQNTFTGETSTGIVGVSNSISDSGNANIYGVFNSITTPSEGFKYGAYNSITSSTTNPSSHVYGTSNLIAGTSASKMYGTYNIVSNTGTGDHYAGYFSAPGNENDYAAVFDEGNVVVNESGKDYDFRIESENIEDMLFVDADENAIGVGTNSPDRTMHIEGMQDMRSISLIKNTSTDINAKGLEIDLASNGVNNDYIIFTQNGSPVGRISGDGSGGVSYNETSDLRLKQNITQYTSGLALLSTINPYSYQMKSAPLVNKIGFLAQELYEVFPISVSGNPSNSIENPMMVDYSKFTPVLVSAVKEQQEVIETQNKTIDELNKRVEKLEALVEQLIKE